MGKAEETGDTEKMKQIPYEYHDAPLRGHRGMNKTYKAIKTKIFFAKHEEGNRRIRNVVR
jgi:hypothetical protein